MAMVNNHVFFSCLATMEESWQNAWIAYMLKCVYSHLKLINFVLNLLY